MAQVATADRVLVGRAYLLEAVTWPARHVSADAHGSRSGQRWHMSEQDKALLVLKTGMRLPGEKREALSKNLCHLAESIGMKGMLVEGDMDVGIHSDIRPLIEEQVAEQRKTNELLALLIDALAESEGDSDEDAEPTRYMDGTPV